MDRDNSRITKSERGEDLMKSGEKLQWTLWGKISPETPEAATLGGKRADFRGTNCA